MKMKKTVITITGIRPDFIRMVKIFKKFDENFNHILIHSGQHYDKMLSDVFFDELQIRKPDYNLEVGGPGKEHFHLSAELSVKVIELIRKENLNPDLIVFIGDSNSVSVAMSLKKEGYKIAHIEAGMRSYDKRMFEEINRIVCDQCSDYLFVYHENYKEKALKEGVKEEQIFVVGNTIIEVSDEMIKQMNSIQKQNTHILLDIHRPENFNDKKRLENIIAFGNFAFYTYGLPVKMINFGRTERKLNEWNISLGNIKLIPLMSYKKYIESVYHSRFIISDSGTAQEEPVLFNTPVIVPRDFTERPESYEYNCSIKLDVNTLNNYTWAESFKFVDDVHNSIIEMNPIWLGDGRTSQIIVDTINKVLNEE
jgi:UDP-N-acetylglucosamine 2-epimerase (non-hydrolysing)